MEYDFTGMNDDLVPETGKEGVKPLQQEKTKQA